MCSGSSFRFTIFYIPTSLRQITTLLHARAESETPARQRPAAQTAKCAVARGGLTDDLQMSAGRPELVSGSAGGAGETPSRRNRRPLSPAWGGEAPAHSCLPTNMAGPEGEPRSTQQHELFSLPLRWEADTAPGNTTLKTPDHC